MFQTLKHSTAAQLCELSYTDGDPHPHVASYATALGKEVTGIEVETHEDVRLTVIQTRGTNYVTVRGTVFESKASATRNLRYDRVDNGRMGVHGGYYAAVNALTPFLTRLLRRQDGRTTTDDVVFTGHSAGGAMASIFAAQFHDAATRNETAPLVKALITFGAPRVGDHRYGNIIMGLERTADVARYTSTSDIVPRLPPIWRGLGHWSPELYLDRGLGVIYEPWAALRWIDGMVVRATRRRWVNMPEAHQIATYVDKLRQRGM